VKKIQTNKHARPPRAHRVSILSFSGELGWFVLEIVCLLEGKDFLITFGCCCCREDEFVTWMSSSEEDFSDESLPLVGSKSGCW
jgi:hypothetical protein